MEYVHKVNIFGRKIMVKSGLEEIILKFLHAEDICIKWIYLIKSCKIANSKLWCIVTIIFRPKILILGTYSILST